MGKADIQAVLKFWFEDSTPENWFMKDEAYDQKIKDNFLSLHQDIMDGKCDDWRESLDGCLAEIIVLDQFSRNMFRDNPKAFASDSRARECLRHILDHGYDKEMTIDQRKFTYLPLEHSEDLSDQEDSVRLYTKLGDEQALDYAIQHKVIIERFGRFPHRNKILSRASTDEEIEFLNQPGSSF